MQFRYNIIYVPSVVDALAFYKAAFGFETRFLHESHQYGELETGATLLAFATHEMGTLNLNGQYQKTDPATPPLGMAIAFVTPDVPAAYAKALAAGAVTLQAPVEKPWGQTVAYLRAQEGTLVELCSPMAG